MSANLAQTAMDETLPQMTEDEFERLLVAKGVLGAIPPPFTTAEAESFHNRQPVEQIPATVEEKPRGMIFEYQGGIYNRPLGRGIHIKDGPHSGLYLDEMIPEGDLEVEIIIRRKPQP